jgi:peptide/nickel transport system ATP-binding protein
MTSAPILSLRNLTTTFLVNQEVRTVVRNVSFEVGLKQTVAIVGESGSGKSVTALSIMRLLSEDQTRIQGRIELTGRDLLSLPEQEMRCLRGNEIAMIFQEPMTSLNPVLTIGIQIKEALFTHRGLGDAEANKEAVALLDRVRIPDARARLSEYPHRLSGGMRQRVMIAMAIACHPKLVIADEPTTALDVTIQAQILSLLRMLQEDEGMSLIFITHDMAVVAEVAERTIVMRNGSIVEERPTADLFSHPDHPYTRALLSAVPRLGTMAGHARPMRFPIVTDDVTGACDAPNEMPDTVVSDATPMLEVKNLTTRFDVRRGFFGRLAGRVHAVENVSFSIQPGQTLSLVGESGCGKSTVARCILRLIEPRNGSVRVGGQDVFQASPRELRMLRRNIQMIFQDPFASLDPRRTIGFSLAEPLILHRVATRSQARLRAAGLLERVGLSPAMASRYPHEFSGGQRQRICIARALALEPKIIVADESVSALDASVKAQIINLMLELQQRLGLAYLFISHDMAVVERVSHAVAVMYLGEIVEIGSRGQIFTNPQHPYTKRLLAAVPVPDPSMRRGVRSLSSEEIRSPIHPTTYVPPARAYREISSGHLVQIWGCEWQ